MNRCDLGYLARANLLRDRYMFCKGGEVWLHYA